MLIEFTGMPHEHVTLPVSNSHAEDDRLTECRVRVATSCVCADSYFNAYRFLRERLGEEPGEVTWLSIVEVMCMVKRQVEDAVIELVGRAARVQACRPPTMLFFGRPGRFHYRSSLPSEPSCLEQHSTVMSPTLCR